MCRCSSKEAREYSRSLTSAATWWAGAVCNWDSTAVVLLLLLLVSDIILFFFFSDREVDGGGGGGLEGGEEGIWHAKKKWRESGQH